MRVAAAVFGGVTLVLGAVALWVTQPWVGAAAVSPPMPPEPKRLEAHVRHLTEVLSPRAFERPDNLDRTAVYLSEQLRDLGVVATEQTFVVEGSTYRNILAHLGPRDGARIILGAHYDAADGFPGADDNASGVAALLEVARLLAATPPKMPVELAFYTLEENAFGSVLMGSVFHARALKDANVAVRAMFSLEMLGCYSDEPGSQDFPLPGLSLLYPTVGNFVTVVGQFSQPGLVRTIKRAMRGASNLPVESINAPRFVSGVDFSDHRSFWHEGYPAVMLTDTAFYRNPRYHTADDTADTLDYQRMADVVRGIYAAVLALAEAP